MKTQPAEKKRVGRPALPPERQRTEKVLVRLSKKELARISCGVAQERLAQTIRDYAIKHAESQKNGEITLSIKTTRKIAERLQTIANEKNITLDELANDIFKKRL
ncbi:MAG: hypothetical protein LBT05_01785 [Planctomycetaceae bacterium]|jgi:peptidyl-tRNA hydrolase|nr:hypothetical protein [Planctomycetaceae bacterium]